MRASISAISIIAVILLQNVTFARPGGNAASPAVLVARTWLNALLQKDAATLTATSNIPFDNQAFRNGNSRCTRHVNDKAGFGKLIKCMFADERYDSKLLSAGSTWKIVPFKAIEQRFSGLPPAASPPDIKLLSSAKNLIFVEGRAKKYEGVVGVYLAIMSTNAGMVVTAALEFGDIQVDSGE